MTTFVITFFKTRKRDRRIIIKEEEKGAYLHTPTFA
jgi:hypothetical protein